MEEEITLWETDKPHLAVFSVSCEAHDKHQKGQQQHNALVTAFIRLPDSAYSPWGMGFDILAWVTYVQLHLMEGQEIIKVS